MTGTDRSAGDPAGRSRVYVRRRGRRTRGQARALKELSSRYCLEPEGPVLEPATVFERDAPLGLEIGFGMGQALVEWAEGRPEWNLLGVEVYQPGIGSALLALEQHDIRNVRLLEAQVEQVLECRLASASLDEVRIFFPDPWPKQRHHKRRLVQPAFVAMLADRLTPGGLLWLATDWADYAQWMVAVLDAESLLMRERATRVEHDEQRLPEEEARPHTRFESRGRRLGHPVWDLRYRRKR